MQTIDRHCVEDVPRLNIQKDYAENIVYRNRSMECLMYAERYNKSKEVLLLVHKIMPGDILWYGRGELNEVEVDERFFDIADEHGYQSSVVIHNHPDSQGLQLYDITELLGNMHLRAVISVGNSCTRSWAMIKNRDYTERKALRALASMHDEVGEDIDMLSDSQYNWCMDSIMKNLKHLGLDYITNYWWRQNK